MLRKGHYCSSSRFLWTSCKNNTSFAVWFALHYLVTCPQTGIPCLPACKMNAYKMILLHSLQFSRKYLYRICLTSCAVIRWPSVTRWTRQKFPYYIQVDVVCVLVDILNIVFLLIPSTLRCSWEVKESWHSWVVERGKVSETLNCNFKLMQLLLEEVFFITAKEFQPNWFHQFFKCIFRIHICS